MLASLRLITFICRKSVVKDISEYNKLVDMLSCVCQCVKKRYFCMN